MDVRYYFARRLRGKSKKKNTNIEYNKKFGVFQWPKTAFLPGVLVRVSSASIVWENRVNVHQ